MYLRQSTIQPIRFGPFLDIADGVTEEVSLTIAQADRRLSKDGGDFAQSGETGNSTHDENGWYFDDLTATDTNTVGELLFYVQDPATYLPVWIRYWVLEEAVYDALFGAAAEGPLQGTTAGNTLDVAATGEAGIDFNNILGTLAAASIATDAFTSVKFAADFLTAAKIADDAITSDQLSQTAADLVWASAARTLTALGFNLANTDFAAGAITATILADAAIDAATLASDMDTYQAKVWMTDDNAGSEDEYMVVWYKNSELVTSGITSPTIAVYKYSDGTDLIASTAMSEIGSKGTYKKTESTNRITDGETVIAHVEATIDGSTRSWEQPISRDST